MTDLIPTIVNCWLYIGQILSQISLTVQHSLDALFLNFHPHLCQFENILVALFSPFDNKPSSKMNKYDGINNIHPEQVAYHEKMAIFNLTVKLHFCFDNKA